MSLFQESHAPNLLDFQSARHPQEIPTHGSLVRFRVCKTFGPEVGQLREL